MKDEQMKAEWGSGRQEVLAAQREIEERLKAGRTMSQVFRELEAGGKFTVTLRTFHRWATPMRKNLDKRGLLPKMEV